MAKCEIGVVGMAVMGQNLVLNMNDHDFKVAVYNRTTSKVKDFIAGPAEGREIYGSETLEGFVGLLSKPRIILLMIKAGQPVDLLIGSLTPMLDPGDVIMDGGNSYFKDTIRRYKELREIGIQYIGTGISGGETGARHGPSIMPGGAYGAWPKVKPILQAVAARLEDGTPMCEWMGSDGAGHYVKMVHNGIEYAYMQLIAETYHIMKEMVGLTHGEMADIFRRWNEGELNSYLIEITADLMAAKDSDGKPLLEKILDAAGQKGTGRWTSESALELGIPATVITEAVFARSLSARKDQRQKAAREIPSFDKTAGIERETFINDLEKSLLFAEIIAYSQGFMLFREAAGEYEWELSYKDIASIWRDGCIIRSSLLSHIMRAYEKDTGLENLLFDAYFQEKAGMLNSGLRRVIAAAVHSGIPVPGLSAALSFYDGFRTGVLPANLIQAQRDYFGSHTYERVDAPRGEYFHTDWTGEGGDVTASSYNA